MNKPIGIFDSGIGGLTVLKEALAKLPGEEFIYYGDTARVPYGGKSKETITRFSIENVNLLLTFDVKLIIVACHTASSLALKELLGNFSLPILGMVESGAVKALQVTRNRKVGVIGTRATILSGAYEASLKAKGADIEVYSAACPLFVPFIEEGWTQGSIIREVVETYLEPLKLFGIDTLILGCTHYPMITEVIRDVLGPSVALVNPAEETAREAAELLTRLGMNHRGALSSQLPVKFYVSDEPEHFRQLGERFLGRSVPSVVRIAEPLLHSKPKKLIAS